MAPVAIEQTPVHVVEQQTASTSVSDDDVLEEFFPELNPRPRNHSSSTGQFAVLVCSNKSLFQ